MPAPMLHYNHLTEVPDSLATRHELRSWGLRPGGPAVATVSLVAAVSGRRRREPLDRVDQAVTMRTRTALSEAAQTPQAQRPAPSQAGC